MRVVKRQVLGMPKMGTMVGIVDAVDNYIAFNKSHN